MNRQQKLFVSGICCLLAALGLSHSLLCAEEAETSKTCPNNCQLRFEFHSKVPVLSQIPFVKYLFAHEQKAEAACPSETPLERVGVDFNLLPQNVFGFMPEGACLSASRSCAADEETCQTASVKDHPSVVACNAEKPCSGCPGTSHTAAAETCELATVCGHNHSEQNHECHSETKCHAACERIAELQAEVAALYSALEAHEALAEAKDAMHQTMIEYATENTRLKAQLETYAEVAKLHERLLAGLAENAQLKATVEVAEERHKLAKEAMQVASENERLKLRIAELELRPTPDSAPTRTAKRSKKTQAR